MTVTSKNVYIDKLDNMIDEYNNTYNRTIKMKPTDIESSTYIDFESNDKNPKFRVSGQQYQNIKIIFAKAYTQNLSKAFGY